MKPIGLIGGISWHATINYYSFINQSVNEHFGDNTNPPILIYNVNQAKMHQFQKEGNWTAISELILEAGKKLENAGAEMVLICSNTTHKVYTEVQHQLHVPLLHIGDAVADKIIHHGMNKVGFIGTIFGMNDPFLTDRIRSYGIEVILPETQQTKEALHRIIHEELTYNIINPESKKYIEDIIQDLKNKGAQAIILGCTEYSLILNNSESEITLLDTINIHAQKAVDFILEEAGELAPV